MPFPPPHPQQAASASNGTREFQQALQYPFHSHQLWLSQGLGCLSTGPTSQCPICLLTE